MTEEEVVEGKLGYTPAGTDREMGPVATVREAGFVATVQEADPIAQVVDPAAQAQGKAAPICMMREEVRYQTKN